MQYHSVESLGAGHHCPSQVLIHHREGTVTLECLMSLASFYLLKKLIKCMRYSLLSYTIGFMLNKFVQAQANVMLMEG